GEPARGAGGNPGGNAGAYLSSFIFATPASFEGKPMEPLMEPSACSAAFLRSPSQRSAGWAVELNTVGEWRDVSAARASGEKDRWSAPQSRAVWQLAHAVLPSSESLVSQNSARPSSASGDPAAVLSLISPNSAAAWRRSGSSARAPEATQSVAIKMASAGLCIRSTI